jgi:hypothetical protein
MKKNAIPAAALAAALLLPFAACESVRDDLKAGWRDKTGSPVWQSRALPAGQAAAYEAALAAGKALGFEFASGGTARGRLEMRTRVSRDGGGARQYLLKARLSADVPGGGTLVEVLITEVSAADYTQNFTQTSERSLRDGALYEAFFRNLSAPDKLPQP